MSNLVFVDTSGFYAALVRNDEMHQKAASYLSEAGRSRKRFITTDYVLDETATLLKARGHAHQVNALFRVIFSSTACGIEWMDQDRFDQTVRFFEKYEDKKWSFTDCFSFLLMKERKIIVSLTKDEDYRQAGFRPLLA